MPDDSNVIPLPPRTRRRGVKGIPPSLPYTALGCDETTLYVLDSHNFLCRIGRNQITRSWIVGLFGEHQELLYELYGRQRETKDGTVAIPRSIHTDHAADDLQRSCAAAGRFDPLARVRGVGAWRTEDGSLALHLGDRLWIPAERRAPASAPLGRHGEHIYLRRASVPAPFPHAVGADTANDLLGYLETWRWGRAIDPLLLLGVFGAAMLAGALEYRPQVDITGEAGVGKSGLQHLARQLLGPRMLLSSDASAAGIRQRTACDALCIGLDEAESTADPKRIADLQQLRRASYGEDGESLRGGVDHTPSLFPLRSVWLSTAITLAPMDAAIRSRTAVLSLLGPPPAGAPVYEQATSDAAMEIVGAKLLRRLADEWRRFDRETLPAWRAILAGHGFDGRAAATYGTLLALAAVLTGDVVPREADYARHAIELDALAVEDRQDRIPTHERLLGFIMGQIVEPIRRSGVRQTVLEKVLLAAGYGDRPGAHAVPEAMAIRRAASDDDAAEAVRELRQLGLALTVSGTGARMLAFSVTAPWLEIALRDTPFAALRGRAEGHARTLLRAPGARRVAHVKFGHGQSAAIAVPLAYVLRGLVGPNPDAEAHTWETIMTGDPVADET